MHRIKVGLWVIPHKYYLQYVYIASFIFKKIQSILY